MWGMKNLEGVVTVRGMATLAVAMPLTVTMLRRICYDPCSLIKSKSNILPIS